MTGAIIAACTLGAIVLAARLRRARDAALGQRLSWWVISHQQRQPPQHGGFDA